MRTCVGLAVLLALVVVLSVLAGRGITAGGPNSDERKVRPEVAGALGQQPEVAVIISLKETRPALGAPDVRALAQDAAVKQERVLSTLTASDFTLTHRYQVVPALAGRITTSGAKKLAAHPDVISIAIDDEVYADLDESVPLINADDVHDLGITGEGVEVAVLDTGINTDHPNLADDVLSENCFLSGWPYCHNGEATDSGPGAAEDDNGHGSHVSGIITSAGAVGGVGVAPDAGIRAYKVLNSGGSGYTSDVIAALDHIAVNYPDTDLVNMSLGDGVRHTGTCDTANPAQTTAINTLRAGGTTVVASSGNKRFKNGLGKPGCISSVISVGMTYDDTWEWASCYGTPCTDHPAIVDTVVCCSNSSPFLDLLAPGAVTTSSAVEDNEAQGRAYVFSGADGSLLFTLETPNPQKWVYFGRSLTVGDVNGDGKADIVVGADGEDVYSGVRPQGNLSQGRAYVFSGADGSLLVTLDTPNGQHEGYFGCAEALWGDLNQDGIEEVVVGALEEDVGYVDDVGRAYVLSGADGSPLYTLEPPNPQAEARFGRSVAVGEVNGDGREDIVVAAPGEDVAGNQNQGRVYVYSGVSVPLLFTLDTPNPQGSVNFGRSVAVGEVNGDGKGDVAVGAPYEDVAGNYAQGRVYFFSGADGSLLLTLDKPGSGHGAYFGYSVAVGDVNGDGKADIVVGAWGSERVYVFPSPDFLDPYVLQSPNPGYGGNFGYSVAVGDVDGDGRGDIAVGAYHETVGDNDGQGRVYVFSGADSSLLLTLDTPDPQASALFGWAVAVGDVDGDGKADVAAGAHGWDGPGTASGKGTSFAAPHVVGVAALLLENDPTLLPYEIEYCLESTGVPITDPGNDLTKPRVDALAALSCTPTPDGDGDGICHPEAPDGASGCTGSDNCPDVYNPDQMDGDEDGLGDACDNCPEAANAEQDNHDIDPFGDPCDIDDDNDGYIDDAENYYGSDPLEADSLVEICNGRDNDGDGRFDEDPVDGVDNDYDGETDEDPMDAIGTDDDGDTLVNEGYDYDGDTVIDEDWDLNGDTVPDCMDPSADNDGDTIANPDDLDDDDDGDPDPGFNDSFEDWKENWMGTDWLDACPDDVNDPAWPPDLNGDRAVNVLDLNGFRLVIGTVLGEGPNAEGRYYDRRYDFNADGSVNVLDLVAYRPVINTSCTNP